IRDKLVTGVQTCALPIFPTAGASGRVWGMHRTFVVEAVRSIVLHSTLAVDEWIVVADRQTPPATLVALAELCGDRLRLVWYDPRSEERRVGKEGRTRGWA